MEFVHSITAGRAATGTTPVHRSPVGEKARQPLSSASTADPRAAAVRRYEGGQLVWRVQCGDLISRERCLTVFVDDDEVVLVGPPGETARLTAGQLGQLRAALNEAAKLAER
ncbi:hypothetical protein DI005_17010 [Prauserella sp. PE36]|uniref:Uncharacterized protein n=1 Tax=Prauserella endophytica TaxID=1592324 RepID=A0ABY2SD15_9PSEU|nr:hypothetical protein BAY59_05005 [Prauserella coralliicola]RBM19368.1 hypothetical protein DI005_17010 [Prauserella sp. PE36]TKG73381.1 hypothetical protein FCN18_02045 [Prauserella endophytica]